MKLFIIHYKHDPEVVNLGGPDAFVNKEIILADSKEKALKICSYPPQEEEIETEKTIEEVDLSKSQVVMSCNYEEKYW